MRDDDRRLARLRELVDRLERLPESAHRDWMLDEVRARMVDVDTGVPPEPLRPRRDIESERSAARRPQRRPSTPPPPERSSPAADVPVENGSPERRDEGESSLDSVDFDEVLSLEDPPDDTGIPPASGLPEWRRGLRG